MARSENAIRAPHRPLPWHRPLSTYGVTISPSNSTGSNAVLAFADDEAGWHLADKTTGITYRSPMDDGQPSDIGYLARLPRPDGKGTFLHLAGIHAVGSDGVVHYLSQHLAELYTEVRTRRFSMLISCDFDPETREITASKQLTGPLRHEGS